MTFQAIPPILKLVFTARFKPCRRRLRLFLITPMKPRLLGHTRSVDQLYQHNRAGCLPDPTAVEDLRGNLQISVYVPRGRGMKALEEYSNSNGLHQ